jgi:MFS transporter, SP family, solute carrier family 2 (myo-inositol transporter), member 13
MRDISCCVNHADKADALRKRAYGWFLLLVAGLGGLLYGIDVGIIGSALPYLEATSHLTAAQLSAVVAAVLLGSVFSTLFAGLLADAIGRKPLMFLSGLVFILSIPVIALSQGYVTLLIGRLLQGVSGGLIGVVVPLYLAECLGASIRGKGTAIFQWLLTLGIAVAALVGIYFSYRVQAVARFADAATLFAVKDQAWRSIFWVSALPGILFVAGVCVVNESPRWLLSRGRLAQARAALRRSCSEAEAEAELGAMQAAAQTLASDRSSVGGRGDSLLSRKYATPFLLACAILFCNTATGVSAIIGYNTGILLESGLSDLFAHWGYVFFTVVNFAMTLVGAELVDRKGRKALLAVGTGGMILALVGVSWMFFRSESFALNCAGQLQGSVGADQTLTVSFDRTEAERLLAGRQTKAIRPDSASLVIVYSYGDFTAVTSTARSDEMSVRPLRLSRESCIPENGIAAFFSRPGGDWNAARSAPLVIRRALLSPIPAASHGWMVALGLYVFMAFYAMGPGVCVWLALSELMPTRIRSNGMSIALVINQLVSTTMAAIFLPFVGKYGYSRIFLLFAGFTLVYFLTAVFLLPETKGKTLEQIEAYFGKRK